MGNRSPKTMTFLNFQFAVSYEAEKQLELPKLYVECIFLWVVYKERARTRAWVTL